MNYPTIELTPAVRRALIAGIDRFLGTTVGNEAEKALARAGYVTETEEGLPVSEALGGYNTAGEHIYVDDETGLWIGNVKPGDTLYFDPEAIIALRIISSDEEFDPQWDDYRQGPGDHPHGPPPCGAGGPRRDDSPKGSPLPERSRGMTNEQAKRQVREATLTAAYHRGPAMTYDDVAAMCTSDMSPRFICEQAELAGFPIWSSAPDEAMKP
jgi:hypothetical protein